MRLSSRIIGQGFGLTAQEMNVLLKEEGFLEGSPGAYSVTAKGERYADEQFRCRGTGGSLQYNPTWTTTTWDDSITNELEVSDERRREIRQKAADNRRASREPVVEDTSGPDPMDDTDRGGISLRPVLLVGGAAVAVFGIYKAAPHIKRFVKEKVAPRLQRAKAEIIESGAPDEDADDLSPI